MSEVFEPLRQQLLDAAAAFTGGPAALPEILTGLVDDVDHAMAEPLEIFPVCHHSPASALAMGRRLREKQPRVVYLELCEDLQPLLTELRNCRLPVALQAFASDLDGFPKAWGPLSVVAPVTEASAEYQAIAYALETPGVELVLVDRSADHVFQWMPHDQEQETRDDTEDDLHGDAVGVEIGDLRPRFAELEEHLLHHGRVRHWSEWWDQYVEQPLAGADHDTYRQVMTLIGSLFRRLTPEGTRRLAMDEDRERYMWTRIREHLAGSGVDRADCLYVCGAFHAVSRVVEAGSEPGTPDLDITPRSATAWLYGLIPSSHSAIEAQFGLAPGSVSIAAATWQKELSRSRLSPFRLTGQKGGRRKTVKALPPAAVAAPATDRLTGYLAAPPPPGGLDDAELRGWCVDLVRLARRNGYLASTADAIAVFETSVLLAGMRGRARPTPYDFQDAAVTCIEKDVVPGRRDVRRICEILLGGDKVGQVGYEALPPLARDVHDRLEPLGLDLTSRTIRRALLDLTADPGLADCSRLLWRLQYLLPGHAVRTIMGSRRLGERSVQESWDLDLGRNQRALIELGYEGVTVEQVLEQRLRHAVHDPKATAADALNAVEDSLRLLDSPRLSDELGRRAVELLGAERTVDEAPLVLGRIRRLIAYYESPSHPGDVLPGWCQQFVTAGYAHYCTLLPTAFGDEETGVRQVAAMLGFLFSMEGLALSLGCERTQLELAVRQSVPYGPAKTALFWAARHQLGDLAVGDLREHCDELLANPLVVPSFPQYVAGFVHALEPVPRLAPFVVETISKAFARLPDPVLLPWLPTLIITLREEAAELVPVLTREAGRTFPGRLPALDAWTAPWNRVPKPGRQRAGQGVGQEAGHRQNPVVAGARRLLDAHPGAALGVAGLLGRPGEWTTGGVAGWPEAEPGATGTEAAATEVAATEAGVAEAVRLLQTHPATTNAVAQLIGG
ncbi:hypothetical protein KIH74_29665 [Kineosporia sp. J2-2]|uniref:Uncharacterized protein n=1 Tax=Kineosporia corallincola TaxID=2835133 RepID=A0ABS5TPV9_9ACTN|nr:DUF5682 family protein [Kineosporia corallincola]MBT0773149.1 hypothetical protein [Kineosporia corallincola]